MLGLERLAQERVVEQVDLPDGEVIRGAPPADRAALEDLVLRLGRLAEDFGEVTELDLNPVIAGPAGCIAVDARVRLASPPAERALKSW